MPIAPSRAISSRSCSSWGKMCRKWIGRDVGADILKRNPRLPVASDPQIDSRNLMTALDHGIGEVELSTQFECTCMHRQRAGGCSRLGCFVDDTWLKPEAA